MTLTATQILKPGKVCVITGASSGIGRAAAMTCASNGMEVWMVDVDSEELKAAEELVASRTTESNQVRKKLQTG